MKKSKITKSNSMDKIIKMIARNEQLERNGGGQWVATHRVHKSKKQYSDIFLITICLGFSDQ